MKKYFGLILFTLIVFGCSRYKPMQRNFYILEYTPLATNLVLPEDPLPYTVQIADSRISRIYDRTQIVGRYSANKVEYLDNELWAVRLSSALPDLIINHFNFYHLFILTDRDFIAQRPDYEVVINVDRIERIQSEFYKSAYLKMELIFRRADDLRNLVRHTIDREDEIFSDDVEIFVQKISHIISEETDLFISKILNFFYEKATTEL